MFFIAVSPVIRVPGFISGLVTVYVNIIHPKQP
jgi:hypothetical protein